MSIKILLLPLFLFPLIVLGQLNKFKVIDSTYVFDKVKYHKESIKLDKLSDTQAYVHTAFFINWCIEKELLNGQFKTKFANSIEKIKNREISPTALYIDMKGEFFGGILTLEGYNFTMQYFHLSNGQYLKDYEKLSSLKKINKSIYSVENTWVNYDIVKKQLDSKYAKWRH